MIHFPFENLNNYVNFFYHLEAQHQGTYSHHKISTLGENEEEATGAGELCCDAMSS